MRFRAEQHLRRALDFQHVRNNGRRHDCGAFMLWYVRQAPRLPSPAAAHLSPETTPPITSPAAVAAASAASTARIGVVASRSAVGNAIQRASAKRRLREIFRAHKERVPAGYDLLLVSRGAINRLEYGEVERKFVEACRKLFPPVSV
jgi:ribonuclease P protein component